MKNNNKLAAYRKLHNLKQEDVAKMLNMSKVSYSYKENGKQEFRLSEAKTLADYFGVTTDYLLGRTETPQFTSKDERDIQKKLTEMIDGLSDDSSLAYLNNGGTEIDEEDAELIRSALERTLRRSKLLAKEKFTPKKYRK